MKALSRLLLPVLVIAGCGDGLPDGTPFAVDVVSFTPGEGAGFGQDRFPDVVLGPPRGGGDAEGSLDVLSLGRGGEIVLRLGVEAVDHPGPDLIVFENPFRSLAGPVFTEPGVLSVSEDGQVWTEHPCDATGNLDGCVGVHPVLANADENDIDPTDPEAAGGDAFDLGAIGVARARFVRIRDAEVSRGFGTNDVGVDLDAVAVIRGASPPVADSRR